MLELMPAVGLAMSGLVATLSALQQVDRGRSSGLN